MIRVLLKIIINVLFGPQRLIFYQCRKILGIFVPRKFFRKSQIKTAPLPRDRQTVRVSDPPSILPSESRLHPTPTTKIVTDSSHQSKHHDEQQQTTSSIRSITDSGGGYLLGSHHHHNHHNNDRDSGDAGHDEVDTFDDEKVALLRNRRLSPALRNHNISVSTSSSKHEHSSPGPKPNISRSSTAAAMQPVVSETSRSSSPVLVPVLLSVVAIPLSMLFWSINVFYSFVSPSIPEHHTDGYNVISPWRWLASVIIPILCALWGLRRKSIDMSGAILGFFMGFILTLTSYAHVACLMAFFFTSSKVTKFRVERKKNIEELKEGGQRNWIQVMCNGGMAAQLAILYLLDVGCGERPIDFDKDYRSSWLSIGIMGAMACCNGDTWASEIGTVVGNSDPFLITSRKRVPRGTNGGVSWIGLLVSALGGIIVGVFHYFTVLYTVDSAVLELAAPQWPIILLAGIGGLLGSIVDSILGATLQYSGINEKGIVVERPGKGVRHISGRQILDNHSVNLLSSMTIALTLPRIANFIWP